MSLPDFQTLMLPVLRLLREERRQTQVLIARLSDEFELTAEERATLLPSGRQPVMHNRVHWALAYLNRAGLITRVRRGEYDIAPPGMALLESPPARIDLPFLMAHYPAIRAFRERANGPAPPSAPETGVVTAALPTPEEQLLQAAAELDLRLGAEVLERVRTLPPSAFETLIVDLLVAMGFGGGRASRGVQIGRAGDGGVDGLIREDALGLDVVYIQAKRYAESHAVGPDAIQAFAGALLERGATKGVFATTSRFTEGARRAAERLSTQRRLVLIDGQELGQLMVAHGVGVRTVQTVTIRRVDLSDYEEED